MLPVEPGEGAERRLDHREPVGPGKGRSAPDGRAAQGLLLSRQRLDALVHGLDALVHGLDALCQWAGELRQWADELRQWADESRQWADAL